MRQKKCNDYIALSAEYYMETKNKLVINRAGLAQIKSLANLAIKDIPPNILEESRDIQIYYILEGLYSYLKSNGIEPPYELKIERKLQ